MTLEVNLSTHHFFKKISPTAGDKAKEPQKNTPSSVCSLRAIITLTWPCFHLLKWAASKPLCRDVKNSNASQSQAGNIND